MNMPPCLHLKEFRHLRVLLGIGCALIPAAFARASLAPPVTPDAQPEVRSLLNYLDSITGNHTLSGQFETEDWFGVNNDTEINFLQNNVGKLPAVRGFDFMFLIDPNDVDAQGHSYQHVAERAIAWAKAGGVVTMCFHWKAGSPNHYSFYTSDSDFDLTKALTDGTPEHTQFLKDMDTVAVELKKLRDAHVPVIWRPFHECSGGWFWWGAKGPDAFKKAWIFMYNRFVYYHGLNNLIWDYNPADSGPNLQAWYPGDQYVDIISLDFYPAAGTHPVYAADYKACLALGKGRKIVAMSENGPIPNPDDMFAQGANWAYWVTWDGNFLTDGKSNSLDYLKQVYTNPKVLTRDLLPDVEHLPGVAPAIAVTPTATSVSVGERTCLAVTATGDEPLAYQWSKDGTTISGATGARLEIPAASAADAGSYSVAVSNISGSVTSAPVAVTVAPTPSTPEPCHLFAISTRAAVGTGDNVLIAGFVIVGPGTKTLLIRAAGPSIPAPLPVLAYPQLELYAAGGGPLLARNRGWGHSPSPDAIAAAAVSTGDFPFQPDSPDSAMIVSLPAGAYTAIASGADGGQGVAIVEVYDMDPQSTAHLKSLSSRGQVSAVADTTSGPQSMIAGFVISGSGSKQLMIRAVGPTLGLAPYNFQHAVKASTLTFYDANSIPLDTNSGWSDDPANKQRVLDASAKTYGFALPDKSKDAVLVERYPAGLATAVFDASDGQPGVGIIEIYDIETFAQ